MLVVLLLVPLLQAATCIGKPRPLAAPGLAGDLAVEPRASCALRLTRSHLPDTRHIAVLGRAPWLAGFLGANDVPVTLLQDAVEWLPVLNPQDDVVFLVLDSAGNRSLVQTALAHIREGYGHYTRVVVWSPAGDPQVVVDAAQDLETVRVAVVVGTRSPRVFRFREECEDGVLVARAVLAGTCGHTTGVLFPDLRHRNLHGCPLKLLVIPEPPFFELQPDPEGGYTLSGTYSVLAVALAKRVNATLDAISLVEPGGPSPSDVKVKSPRAELVSRRAEVFFGVAPRVARPFVLDQGPSFYIKCLSFSVPSGLGGGPGPFDLVYREFRPAVWFLVVVAYVAVVVTLSWSWTGVLEHAVQDAAFFALSALVGNSFVAPMTTARVRALTVCWFVLCIVLGTVYQAVRHSLVAVPPQAPEITSLSQLVDSGLPVMGDVVSISHLTRLAQEQGNSTLLALSARTRVVADVERAVHQMATQRDVAFFCTSFVTQFYSARLEAAAGRKLVYHIPGYCGSFSLLSFFAVREGSPMTPVVVDLVTQTLDMGLLGELNGQLEFGRREQQQDLQPLGLDRLGAPFQLLAAGLTAAALVFVTEVLVRRSRQLMT